MRGIKPFFMQSNCKLPVPLRKISASRFRKFGKFEENVSLVKKAGRRTSD
jgi:hypothetical protein